MVLRSPRRLLVARLRVARYLALSCFVLMPSCGDSERADVEPPASADALHLFDQPLVVEEGTPDGSAPDELFGDEDLWIYKHPLPDRFWEADPRNEGFDRIRLPLAIAGEALVHSISRRAPRKKWRPLQREEPLPEAGEFVLDGIYIRRLTGSESIERAFIDFPTAPRALASHLGLATPTGERGFSELTLGIDCRRAKVVQAPAQFVYQVELPKAARLDLGFAVRRQELLLVPGGARMHGAQEGRTPTFRVIVEQEDGTRTVVWERSIEREKREKYMDATVDLGVWSEQVVRLRLECSMPAPEQTDDEPTKDWKTFAVWAEPTVWSAEPSVRPNIIVLLIDTLRADRLGSHGWERARTPNLDGIAERGVRFADAMSAASWTLPSHASIFTSTYPSQHGLWKDQRLPETLATVAEVLRDGGYRTAAFAERGFLKADHGFARGFERFNSKVRDCKETFSLAADWMEERESPFFAFVHTYKVHAPYIPSEEFSRDYVREYKGERTGVQLVDEIATATEGPPPEADVMLYLSDLYDAEIAEMDFAVGEFTQRLEAAGLLENTLLVITSDHGEEFYEHGGISHGMSLYQEQLHIPLIVHWKGHMEGGLVVTHPVHGVDIAPTLAAAAQLDVPRDWVGLPLVVEPGEGQRDLFAPMRVRWATPELMGQKAVSVRRGQLKYVDYPDGLRRHDEQTGPRLYDLASDPHEHTNLLDGESALLWAERAEELRARYPQMSGVISIELDEDARRELEKLGYAGGDE